MFLTKLLLLTNLSSTLYMVGLIWFVQIVHYPLFNYVGKNDFNLYESKNTFLTTLVVGAPMLLEAFTSLLLVIYKPIFIKTELLAINLLFLIIIWLSTAFLQVPQHNKLTQGFNNKAYKILVNSNWVRTIFWTARAVILLIIFYKIM